MEVTRPIFFVCALVALCTPSAAFADSGTFLDKDGTLTASYSDGLALHDSGLAGVSNLGAYDCFGLAPVGSCNGMVSFSRRETMALGGSLIGNAFFAGASAKSAFGSLGITGGNSGTDFIFTGSFSKASRTESSAPSRLFWRVAGPINDGVLTEGSGPAATTMPSIDGAIVDFVAQGSASIVNINDFNHSQSTDSGGNTTLPPPVAEAGTLTLLGCGLVWLGILARGRHSRRSIAPQFSGAVEQVGEKLLA